MKLAAMPKAFGLHEIKKGYFPHFFNTKSNLTTLVLILQLDFMEVIR